MRSGRVDDETAAQKTHGLSWGKLDVPCLYLLTRKGLMYGYTGRVQPRYCGAMRGLQ